VAKPAVSVLVAHRCPDGDPQHSVDSVLEQGYPRLTEIVVVTGGAASYPDGGVQVARCEDGAIDAWIEQLSGLTVKAPQTLDGQRGDAVPENGVGFWERHVVRPMSVPDRDRREATPSIRQGWRLIGIP
jgi:hypothetical protein